MTVLAGLLLNAPQTHAADPYVYRVGGTVTDENFAGLAAFMMNSVDQFVGLKVSIPRDNGPNGVSTEESNGLLSVFKKDSDVNLAFSSGYRKDGDHYFVDGFFKVTYGGLHQGINGLGLSPARTMDVEAAGKPMKVIDIDKLQADADK